MSANIKYINLGKKESDSDCWVADVNDIKMQEIADALGMKLNTVVSDSEWYLYRGSDNFNTTGIRFLLSSTTLQIMTYVKGVRVNNSNLMTQVNIPLQRSAMDSGAMVARLYYAKGKDDAIIFGISSDNSEYLSFIISSAKQIDSDIEKVIYISTNPTSSNGTISAYFEDSDNAIAIATAWTAGSDSFVMLIPASIPGANMILNNLYIPYCLKNMSGKHWSFAMNSQQYIVSDYYAQGTNAVVMALPSDTE